MNARELADPEYDPIRAVNTPGAHYIDGDGEEWIVGENGDDRDLIEASGGDVVRYLEMVAEMQHAAHAPDPSWTEDAEGYVIAPLDWKGAK